MKEINFLATILGITPKSLSDLDEAMVLATGKKHVLEHLYRKNEGMMKFVLEALKQRDFSSEAVSGALRQVLFEQEKRFFDFLQIIEGKDDFERAARLARKIAQVGKGFFLKKELGKEILRKREPKNLLAYLKVRDVEELIEKHDITEIFSALRFIETDEWMHETFTVAYSEFGPEDFEERDIEIRVLGPQWHEVAEKFVAKKHHNVSHLKEFGVIFINPIAEDIPGKFLRDFALLLHYFHEIEFYSKLFKRYAQLPDFNERFNSLLRGDILNLMTVKPGEWLIVQRYLAKINPNDARLFLPHVNPESLHWMRGERDLTLFRPKAAYLDLSIWQNLDWVGGVFTKDAKEVVSFDLEDNAMSLVSFMEGRQQNFNYHQREALWTKLFIEYAGGEEKAEQLLLEYFDKGLVRFC